MSVSLTKKDYERLVRASAKGGTAARGSGKKRRYKMTFARRMNKFLVAAPLLVLGISLNGDANQVSSGTSVLQYAGRGDISNASLRISQNFGKWETYKPALVTTAMIGGYKMLKRLF